MPCGCNSKNAYTKSRAIIIGQKLANSLGAKVYVYFTGTMGYNFTTDYDFVKTYIDIETIYPAQA